MSLSSGLFKSRLIVAIPTLLVLISSLILIPCDAYARVYKRIDTKHEYLGDLDHPGIIGTGLSGSIQITLDSNPSSSTRRQPNKAPNIGTKKSTLSDLLIIYIMLIYR
jgi:hypothetical protein